MRPMLALLLAALCACAAILPTAHALYEEQAGLIDWHMSHLGGASSLLFRPTEQQSVIVSTRAGVLGALSTGGSLASGETRWRQVLPEGERIEATGAYSKLRVISVSSESAQHAPAAVRAWNTKDGSLVWETNVESPLAHVVANQTATMSLQRKLRMQGAAPVADEPFAFTGGAVSSLPDANGDGKADVLVLHGSVVALLSGIDGALLWSWAAPDAFEGLGFAVRGAQLAVVGSVGDALRVHILRVSTGAEVRSRSIAFAPKVDTRNVVVAPSAGALLLLDGLRLTTVVLFDEPAASGAAAPKDAVVDLSKEGMSGACYLELLGESSSGSAIVAVFAPAADKQLVLEAPAAGAPQIRRRFTSAKGEDVEFGWAAGATDASLAPLVRAVLAKDNLRIEAVELANSAAPAAVLVQSEAIGARGGIKHMWVETVAADKKAAARYRVFLTCVDDSLSLLEASAAASKSSSSARALLWTREEALASVLAVQFVELPVGSAESAADEEAGHYPSFLERLAPQLQAMAGGVAHMFSPQRAVAKVQEAVHTINSTIQALAADDATKAAASSRALAIARASTYARPLSAESRASLLTQDYFGFRKLLLVSTSAGKLYALESQTGAIVWMRFLSVGAGAASAHEADERAAPVAKVYVLSHHEAVGVMHDDEETDGKSGRSHLVGFNPLTGEPLSTSASVSLSFRVATGVVLPHLDSHGRRILLVADATGQVALYPPTPEASALVRAHAPAIFYYTLDVDAQVLRGFSLHAGADASGQQSSLAGVPTWLLRFPHRHERIVAVAPRPPHETVQSAVRVLGGGDGGYLHKYLNPNLLALATVRLSPSAQSSGGGALPRVVPSLRRTTDPSVNVYLLDTVSGAVLERVVHRDAEGPVTLLQTENSVVTHFYSPVAAHYVINAIELFENRADAAGSGAGSVDGSAVVAGASSVFQGLTLSSLAGQLRRGAGPPPFDSFGEGAPQSLQQSFTFRSAIRALGVSQTRRGITSKEILIGLPSAQLYALPRALVDPRRPLAEPTPMERAEGLIPYSAVLPVDRLRVVSHVHAIGALRGVVSSASLLESTSLVCAHGLDLFCTRVTPSQTFDLLNEDFNSPFLIATVTAVFLAIAWTRRMAKAKEIAQQWK